MATRVPLSYGERGVVRRQSQDTTLALGSISTPVRNQVQALASRRKRSRVARALAGLLPPEPAKKFTVPLPGDVYGANRDGPAEPFGRLTCDLFEYDSSEGPRPQSFRGAHASQGPPAAFPFVERYSIEAHAFDGLD